MDFLDQTIEAWQPYSERPLTREDAREITHNVVGFVRLLREWEHEERQSERFGISDTRKSLKGNSSSKTSPRSRNNRV